ncbi:MAG TPA: DUF5819 family protein [Bacteroidia bacterium]|jgi:hypothetical protein|nr:DUF5819 family protein [Bacteroidia bacterium]
MKKPQYVIFICCSAVLVFHVFCTLFFNFYSVTENTLVVRVVRRYMLPIFSQNNKVFAPNPPLYNQQLIVRYYNGKRGWTSWINPGQNLLNIRYSNPFNVAGTEHKVHEYVLAQIWDAHIVAQNKFPADSLHKPLSDSLQNDFMLHDARCIMAQHYFSDMMLKETGRTLFSKLQYKVIFTYPQAFSGKAVSDIKATTGELLFPEMNFIPRHVQVK